MKNSLIRGVILTVLALPWAALALPGQLDTAFTNVNFNTTVNTLQSVANDRVVLGLENVSPVFGGTNLGSVIRLETNGLPDPTFACSDTNRYSIKNVLKLADGSLLVNGSFTSWAGSGRLNLVKLDANGALQTNFTSAVNSTSKMMLGEQPDGRILVAVVSGLKTNTTTIQALTCLLPSGVRDTNFVTTNLFNQVYALDVVPDGSGKFFAGFFNGVTFQQQLMRFNTNGTVDTNFAPVTLNGQVLAVKALANGGVYAAGGFTTFANTFGTSNVTHLIRVNANGSLDSSFNFIDSRTPSSFALQADGKVIVPNTVNGLDRFNSDGSPSADWTRYTLYINQGLSAIAVDSSDRVHVAMSGYQPNFTFLYSVFRFQSDASYGPIAPYFSTALTNQSIFEGGAITLQPFVLGPGPIGYQWFFNSNGISGATNLSLTLTNCQLANDGFYQLQVSNSFGTTLSTNARLTVLQVPPVFYSPVVGDQLGYPGYTATFSSGGATGTGPITYQWQFNSNNIAGATNLILTITNCQLTEVGFYRLLAINPYGSTASANGFLDVLLSPQITQSPQAVSADASDTVTFSVSYNSFYPVTFQWYFNNSPIAGATNNPLVIAPVSSTNAGNYYVTVSNNFGPASSAAASLTVNGTLRFKQQPATNLVLITGTSTNLSVVAAGNPPLSYRWYYNSNLIAGATGSALSFNPADRTNSGNYYVVVTNNAGAITSSVAQVAVFGASSNTWLATNALPGIGSGGTTLTSLAADGPLGVVLASSFAISRFDDDGSLRWSTPFIPSTNMFNLNISPVAVAVDGRGNTYVAGDFKGTVSLGGLSVTNPGTLTLNNPNGRASLLAKLNSAGQAVWIRYIDGALNYTKLAVDGSGAVVISGGHTSVLVFGANTVVKNDYGSAVIARYLPDGTFHWVRDYQYSANPGNMEIDAVTAEGTNIWVGGIFNVSARFGTFTTTTLSTTYWFGRMNTNGTEAWLWTHSSGAQGLQLSVGPDQTLWAANTGFLGRYATNGSEIIGGSFGSSSGTLAVRSLCVDSNSVGVLGGYFNASTTLGTNTFTQPNGLTNYCYASRHGTNGTGQGAVVLGSSSTTLFPLVAGNRRGDLYTAGVPTVQLNGNTITGTNVYLAKISAPVLAPSIRFQPIAAYTNSPLQNFGIGVVAQGEQPLVYQWRKNGVAVPGATNANLSFTSPLPADSGAYDCVVSNAWGVAISTVSQITMQAPFTLSTQPKTAGIILGTNDVTGADIVAGFIASSALPGRTLHMHITNGTGMWPMTADFDLNLPTASSYNIPNGSLGAHASTWNIPLAIPGQTTVRLFNWSTVSNILMSTITLWNGGYFDIHHDIADPAGCCAQGWYSIGAGGSSNVTFNFNISGVSLSDTNLAIQWYRNGVALPGQTNLSVSYTPAGYPQAGTYYAAISYGSFVTNTTPVTLNIYPPALGYTFVPGGSNMNFSIPPGYVLQSTTSLAPPNWTTISTNATYSVPLSQPGAYFRIAPQ